MASPVTTTLWHILHFRHTTLPLVLFPAYFQSPVSVGRKSGLALPVKNLALVHVTWSWHTYNYTDVYTNYYNAEKFAFSVPAH